MIYSVFFHPHGRCVSVAPGLNENGTDQRIC